MVVSYSIPVPSVMGIAFHQHLFDFNPLLEQELVLDLLGLSQEMKFGGQHTLQCNEPSGQEGRSRSSGNIGVRGSLLGQFSRNSSIQGGLACSAVLEQDILRCYGDAALGHDCCLSEVRVLYCTHKLSWSYGTVRTVTSSRSIQKLNKSKWIVVVTGFR
jgi:hypothetical protein